MLFLEEFRFGQYLPENLDKRFLSSHKFIRDATILTSAKCIPHFQKVMSTKSMFFMEKYKTLRNPK